MLFWQILGHLWCPVVTLLTLKRNKKAKKQTKKQKTLKKIFKKIIPRNPRKKQNKNQKTIQKVQKYLENPYKTLNVFFSLKNG